MRRSFSPFLTHSLVAFAVAGSLFLLHASVAEDQHSHTGWGLHESVPTLIVGTLMGGAVGGIIAAWLLLKFDFKINDQLDNVADEVKNLNQKFDELYGNLKRKLSCHVISLNDNVNVSIRKINELQSSIDELKKPVS